MWNARHTHDHERRKRCDQRRSRRDDGRRLDGEWLQSTTPVTLAIGQSTTETLTLTPDSSTALNSTLDATVTVGPAAAQDVASVLDVTPNPGSVPAGEPVDVSTDIFAGVLDPEQAEVSYTVTNSTGGYGLHFHAGLRQPRPALPQETTLDLGSFGGARTSLRGATTITVSVDDTNGQPIAGATGTGAVTIGLPLAASLALHRGYAGSRPRHGDRHPDSCRPGALGGRAD